MDKLHLVPDSNGYSSTDGEEAIYTKLDGGAGRYRQDKIGASKMVSVQWTLNAWEYEYWRAFFRTATKKGSLPFLCDLLSEDGKGATEHTCNFIPGSVSLPTQRGLTYVQRAQLEVTPLAIDAVADQAIIDNADAIYLAGGHLQGFAP